MFSGLGSARQHHSAARAGPGEQTTPDGLHNFQRSDFRLLLADGLLTKMDIATMANSLEARSPFLDIPLVEFAWSLPEHWLIKAGETKPLLRELARKRLPASIASAPKRGFEVPVKTWLENDLREPLQDLLLSPGGRVAALGDGKAMRNFVQSPNGFAGNHALAVWCLLVLEVFLRAPTPASAG